MSRTFGAPAGGEGVGGHHGSESRQSFPIRPPKSRSVMASLSLSERSKSLALRDAPAARQLNHRPVAPDKRVPGSREYGLPPGAERRPGVHDLVIRGGTVVDGTGSPGRTADVAVEGGIVVEVGRVDARGRQELDADGALV